MFTSSEMWIYTFIGVVLTIILLECKDMFNDDGGDMPWMG